MNRPYFALFAGPGSDYGYGKKINISFDPCRSTEWVAR